MFAYTLKTKISGERLRSSVKAQRNMSRFRNSGKLQINSTFRRSELDLAAWQKNTTNRDQMKRCVDSVTGAEISIEQQKLCVKQKRPDGANRLDLRCFQWCQQNRSEEPGRAKYWPARCIHPSVISPSIHPVSQHHRKGHFQTPPSPNSWAACSLHHTDVMQLECLLVKVPHKLHETQQHANPFKDTFKAEYVIILHSDEKICIFRKHFGPLCDGGYVMGKVSGYKWHYGKLCFFIKSVGTGLSK